VLVAGPGVEADGVTVVVSGVVEPLLVAAGLGRNRTRCRRRVTSGLIRVNYTCIQGANRITFVCG
jgi:hypothetical protein